MLAQNVRTFIRANGWNADNRVSGICEYYNIVHEKIFIDSQTTQPNKSGHWGRFAVNPIAELGLGRLFLRGLGTSLDGFHAGLGLNFDFAATSNTALFGQLVADSKASITFGDTLLLQIL